MTRLNRIYPFLFAALPMLQIAIGNPGTWTTTDLAMMLLGAVAATALVYAVLGLIARGRWGDQLPALGTTLVVLGFYRYVKTVRWVGQWAGPAAHPLLIVVFLGVGLALLWWFARRPQLAERVGTFLALTSVLLVGFSLARLAAEGWQDRRLVQESGLLRRLARPIATRPAMAHAGAPRDIYLIVLDEYANSSVLRERLGFDNRPFEDSLRALGFIIPVVHSNYVHTAISIPSLINSSHLLELGPEMGPRSKDPTLPNYLVQNNRSARFLRAHGYQYILFPSQWWLASAHSPEADLEFHAWDGWSVGRELSQTEFRRVIRAQTPLKVIQPDYRDDVDYVRSTFGGLAQLAANPAPTFAFAHVINPHPPFVFDPQCRPASRSAGASDKIKRRVRYLEQLNCLNGLVLQLVTTLIRTSPQPPIILLQGDHGTNTLRFSNSPTAEAIPIEKARERLGAFGAFYLPGGGDREFGDSVSLVNVMGNVLRYYFGADLPREPDDMYLSLEGSPFLFHRVSQLQ
jgi:sulfatase-like protein